MIDNLLCFYFRLFKKNPLSALRNFLILGVCILATAVNGISQCAEPVLDAGLFCDPNAPSDGAPIICALACLDGFAATMPADLLDNQPETLCAGNGTPNNLSWFAFVAGGTTVDLTITPSNCTEEIDANGDPIFNTIGIQAGIYSSCNFEDEDLVTCFNDCGANRDNPVNLASNDFNPGQTYYLFVDGCGGSVCDYVVTVNSAMQAFEVPEITTITNQYNYDFDTDTICQGAEVTFRLDDLDFDIGFHWEISPATSTYPTGLHPQQDTNIVTFTFADEGVFDMIVFAYNDCDANTPDTFQVVVRALEDEIFADVVLCEECILDGISLVAPDAGCIISQGVPMILTEDPNGDGVAGWLGLTEVTMPGLQPNLVTNSLGCQYMQSVNVVEIPLPAREVVDLFFCVEDFPVTEAGVVFNMPGQSRNITLDNASVQGCDSLINVTARAIDIFGQGVVSGCQDGMVSITFDPITIEPADHDSITYIWLDDMGISITDGDADDAKLDVMIAGRYSVSVTVHKDGQGCSQLFGPYDIDADNLTPQVPMIAFAPNEACDIEGTAKIYVDDQNLGETYSWTLTPMLPFIMGGSSDTIYVDISSATDFEYCVSASNSCGQSAAFCDIVVVSSQPSSVFDLDQLETCIDSTVWVTYTGTDGQLSTSEFTWSFDGAMVLNGADLLGAGPFQLGFSDARTYSISMYLTENGCQSATTTHVVDIVDRFVLPSIVCHQGAGFVAFTFDDADVDGIMVDVLTGQSVDIVSSDSIVINGLMTEETVEIEIVFNSEHTCGGQSTSFSCSSLPCPVAAVEVVPVMGQICLDSDGVADLMIIDVEITGDQSGIGQWTSSMVVDGVFDPVAAGVGLHVLTYRYEVGGCEYTDAATVQVDSAPDVAYVVGYDWCVDGEGAVLTVIAEDGLIILVDGAVVTEDQVAVAMSGTYEIEVQSTEGCTTVESVEVASIDRPDFDIIGGTEVIAGSRYEYGIVPIDGFGDVRYEWTIDGEVLCEDCFRVNYEVEEDTELCVTALFTSGCAEVACIELRSTARTVLHVPNIFSPNSDNINDIFTFQASNEATMIESVRIYDRYGQLMYQDTKFMNGETSIGWDGQMNGRPCTVGVYAYIIMYRDIDGALKQKVGDITLMR